MAQPAAAFLARPSALSTLWVQEFDTPP